MLRRSELKRKTPLRTTGARLSSGSGATLSRQAPLQRAAIKRRAPKKRAGHAPQYLAACRGEPCYLQIPGVCRGECERDSVVPCHANRSAYGKGMGIKAHDIYTVPGCFRCHACLDSGFSLTSDEKRATWEWAYNRWLPVRAGKLQEAL